VTLFQALSSLAGTLDRGVGLAWAHTEGDFQREYSVRRGWRRGATCARYVTAFASLLAVALWRHETRRAGVAAWRAATWHAWRVWRQNLALFTICAGVVGLATGDFGPLAGFGLGAVYGATLVGSVTVGLGLPWSPFGRVSAPLPLPLPLRVRAAAAMAPWVVLMIGQVLPLAVRFLSDTWTYGPIGLDASQRTVVENLMLTATFAARGEFHLALIVLPALTLPFVMTVSTLCAPLVAHGVEHRLHLSYWRTGLTLALLTSVQLALLIIVGVLTFAARWPVAALMGQCLLVTIAGVAAMQGLTAVVSTPAREVT
jgi:hypothetical protein